MLREQMALWMRWNWAVSLYNSVIHNMSAFGRKKANDIAVWLHLQAFSPAC